MIVFRTLSLSRWSRVHPFSERLVNPLRPGGFWIFKNNHLITLRYFFLTQNMLDLKKKVLILFLHILLMTSQHWHSWCPGAGSAPGHQLCQWWQKPLTPYGVTRPQWVKEIIIVFVSTYSTDDKSALAQLMSWRRFGARTSAVPMLTKALDAI